LNSISGAQEAEEMNQMEQATSSRYLAPRPQPWVNHQHSFYQDYSHEVIENEVNMISTQKKELKLSLKPRRLEHPMMSETPLKPAFPTITYRPSHSYSQESLNRDDYGDSDDQDDYGSDSGSDFYGGGYGGGVFYDSDRDRMYYDDYDDDDFDIERYCQWR